MFIPFIFLAALGFPLISAAVPPTGCKYKDPLPSDATCNLHGRATVIHSSPHLPIPFAAGVGTVYECRDLCFRHPPCATFGFNTTSKLCRIYNKGTVQIKPGPSAVKFNDLSCYDCPRACPQPLGVEVIDNGGFQFNDKFIGPFVPPPQGRAHSKKMVYHPGHNSSNAWACKGPRLTKCSLNQQFTLCNGQLYRFGYDYLAQPKQPEFAGLLEIQSLHRNTANVKNFLAYNFLGSRNVEPFTWETYYGYMLAEDGGKEDFEASFYFESEAKSDGKLRMMDNFRFYPVEFPTAAPNATELLRNPGFETGKKKPWKDLHSSTYKIVSPGIGSNYALQYTALQPLAFEFIIMQEKINFIPGSTYLISFDYSMPELPPGILVPWAVTIEKRTQSVTTVNQYLKEASGTFKQILVAQRNYHTLQIYLNQFPYGVDPGKLIVDNFSVKEVAAP